MNTERILKLADHIEKLEHVSCSQSKDYSDKYFNMNVYVFDYCGSPACIAGHAVHMFSDEPNKRIHFDLIRKRAQDLLGLDLSECYELFNVNGRDVLYTTTPKHAAATLRHFAETGVIDWEYTKTQLEN